jgi:hypothetical protein
MYTLSLPSNVLCVDVGPRYTLHPYSSSYVVFSHVTVSNPPGAPHTDGIDPDSCDHVLIDGCVIHTSDDHISLKSGKGSFGVKYGVPTTDVVVQNCEFGIGGGDALSPFSSTCSVFASSPPFLDYVMSRHCHRFGNVRLDSECCDPQLSHHRCRRKCGAHQNVPHVRWQYYQYNLLQPHYRCRRGGRHCCVCRYVLVRLRATAVYAVCVGLSSFVC